MHVFYTPDIQTHAELPEEEAAHAVRVLRLQPCNGRQFSGKKRERKK